MPDLLPLAPWAGILLTLGYNIFNHYRTSRIQRASQFSAAFNDDLNDVVKKLREVRKQCELIFRTMNSHNQAIDVLRGVIEPLIADAQNLLTFGVARLKDSDLCTQKESWSSLVSNERWDTIWEAYKAADQTREFAPFSAALRDLEIHIARVHDELLKAKDKEC